MEILVNVGQINMDLDLKLAFLGDLNLEYIGKYWYQSSLSISLYLNISPRVNLHPTRNGYM